MPSVTRLSSDSIQPQVLSTAAAALPDLLANAVDMGTGQTVTAFMVKSTKLGLHIFMLLLTSGKKSSFTHTRRKPVVFLGDVLPHSSGTCTTKL